MLNNLRMQGISPSGMPSNISSNISSMSNYKIVNEISKLRVKLSSDEYIQARTIYKKVIKSINITFIKLLYARQYYNSIHNNPILDFDYLFEQYNNKNIVNPDLYKLLKEHLLQTNLIKFIIFTHFCNKFHNKISDKIISDKIIDIFKAYIGIYTTEKKSYFRGRGGGELTEEQKKLLVSAIVFCALAIDDEKTRNSFKKLIEEVNSSNSKEIIKKIDEVVADSNIPATRRFYHIFSIMNLENSYFSVEEKIKQQAINDMKKELDTKDAKICDLEKLNQQDKNDVKKELDAKDAELLAQVKLNQQDKDDGNRMKKELDTKDATIRALESRKSTLPSSTGNPGAGAAKSLSDIFASRSANPGAGAVAAKSGTFAERFAKEAAIREANRVAKMPASDWQADAANDEKRAAEKKEAEEAAIYKISTSDKKVEILKIKAEEYITNIQQWIKDNEVKPDFKTSTDKGYIQGDLTFYKDSNKKMMKEKEKIDRIREKNESKRSTVKNDPATKLLRVIKARNIFSDITCYYEAVKLKHQQFIDNKNCIESEKNSKNKKPISAAQPKLIGKVSSTPEDELLKILDCSKLSEKYIKKLKFDIPINFKRYRKIIIDIENSITSICDIKYQNKLITNLCEIQMYIEDIRKIILDTDTDEDEFKKKLKDLEDKIAETEKSALYTANKANPPVGGSLLYYKKYLKYKSKYLQIK